jgi:hypothetical protein
MPPEGTSQQGTDISTDQGPLADTTIQAAPLGSTDLPL